MRDRGSGSVLICGIIPWRMMYVSSLGFLRGGGSYFQNFPMLLPGVTGDTQLAYVQRYIGPHVLSTLECSRFVVVCCKYLHLRDKTLGAYVLCSRHCHSITLMGNTLVYLCCIM
jgi:hypothetical protein